MQAGNFLEIRGQLKRQRKMNQPNNKTHDNFTCPICDYSVTTAVRAGLLLGSLEAVGHLVSVVGVEGVPKEGKW